MSKIYKKVVRSYKAGEVIFEQGAACDGIYSVKVGWVSIYKTKLTPNGPVDREIVKLGPGSMFGEMGMLDQTKRDCSVKALEFTEVLIITPDMFEDQMTSLPPWVVNFIKILISRLRITNEKLVVAHQQLEAHGLPVQEEKVAAVEPAAVKDPARPKPLIVSAAAAPAVTAAPAAAEVPAAKSAPPPKT